MRQLTLCFISMFHCWDLVLCLASELAVVGKKIQIVYLFMSNCLQRLFLFGFTLSLVGTFLIDLMSDSFFVAGYSELYKNCIK